MRVRSLRLSANLLKAHRVTYTGAFSAVVLASFLVTICLSLYASADAGDGIETAGLSSNASATLLNTLLTTRYVVGIAAGITTFVVVFLIASSIAFVVGGRRQELALLRVSGATPGQLGRLIVAEVTLLATTGAVIGAAGSVLALRPTLAALVAADLAPVELRVTVRPLVLLGGAALTVMAAMLGARLTTRRIGKVEPIEALAGHSQRAAVMTRGRWVAGALAVMLAIGLFVLPSDWGDFQAMTILFAGALFGAATAFAPLLVPGLGRLLGHLWRRLAPGPGLLATSNATFYAGRTAAVATPVILLLGLTGATFMMAFTGGYISRQGQTAAMRAEVIVQGDARKAPLDIHRVTTDLAALHGVRTAVPFASLYDWGWQGPHDPLDYPTVALTNPTALPAVLHTTLVAGDLGLVRGNNVATTTFDPHPLGSVLQLQAPDGSVVEVTVVAVLKDTALLVDDVIADAATFSPRGSTPYGRWFVATDRPDDVVRSARTTLAGLDVMSVQEWVDRSARAQWQSQSRGLTAMAGSGGLLAVLALVQNILATLRERRTELGLLLHTGASRGALLVSALFETVTVNVTAIVLAAVLLGFTYLRFDRFLHVEGYQTSPVVPVGVLGLLSAIVAVIALVTTCAGWYWSLGPRGARRAQSPPAMST